MNIKLLKKLRKEASKRYAIKRMATGFYTYDMKRDFRCGNGTDTLEEQKHNCKEYMASWIKDSVKELRRKYKKWRDIHYYPTGKKLEAFFGGDMCNNFKNYMKGE